MRFTKVLFLGVCVLVGLFLSAQAVQAQPHVAIKIYATDGVGSDSVMIGVDSTATFGIDTALGERELPPRPPTFDFRVVSNPISGDNIGLGSKIVYHPSVLPTQTDYYRVSYQSDETGGPAHLTWNLGLGGVGGGYWKIWDASLTTVLADMTVDTSWTAPPADADASPHFVFVIKGDAKGFTTVTYDSLAGARDAKGKQLSTKAKPNASSACFTVTTTDTSVGLHAEYSQGIYYHISLNHFNVPVPDPLGKVSKFDYSGDTLLPGTAVNICLKGSKGKALVLKKYWFIKPGQIKIPSAQKLAGPPASNSKLWLPMPNWNNMGEELYTQGAFAPIPPGLVIGITTQAGVDIKGKPFFKYVYHPKWADVKKTLLDKTGLQTGAPGCLNIFLNNSKPILKGQKSLPPNKGSNQLLGAALALKFNIAMNDFGKVMGATGPSSNFSSLIFKGDTTDPPGFDGLTVAQIAAKVDTFMSCLGSPIDPAKLLNTVRKINSAFSGPFDTASFGGKTTVPANKALAEVTVLHRAALAEARPSIVNTNWVRPEVPVKYELMQNYPNPFNPTTTIEFNLERAAQVTLVVYNILGQKVATLADHAEFDEGNNAIDFDASRLSSGVYYYRLTVEGGQFQQVKKMMLLK